MPRLGTPEVSSSHQIQPRVGQFQYIRSTSSSVPVPVYLPHIQFQSTYLISSSSLLLPALQFQSTSSQDQPRVWGVFPVMPLHLQAMQVHLDWLIFVGSSLYKDSSSFHVGFLFSARTHLHSLLILMAVTSLKCGFLCECVCLCVCIIDDVTINRVLDNVTINRIDVVTINKIDAVTINRIELMMLLLIE